MSQMKKSEMRFFLLFQVVHDGQLSPAQDWPGCVCVGVAGERCQRLFLGFFWPHFSLYGGTKWKNHFRHWLIPSTESIFPSVFNHHENFPVQVQATEILD